MNTEAGLNETERTALAGELRIVLGALARRLREQTGGADLTASQKSVLLRLEKDGPATISALARAESMKPQSMGAIVAALQTTGFVTGTPDPADGRQTILSLTDACRIWIGQARAAREDFLLRTITARLRGPEQHQLAAAVKLLHRLFET